LWRSSPAVRQRQAAEPSDFEADLVAVLVVPVLAEESEEVDLDESVDELPDSLDDPEVLAVPALPDESLPVLLPDRLLEPVLRRESLRESLR
jgi:hypothetical protein